MSGMFAASTAAGGGYRHCVRVLRTPDGAWRAEQWPDGWRLHHLGVLLLTRATLDQVVTLVIERGGVPEHLRED